MLGEQSGDQPGLAQWLDDLLFRFETWRPNVRPAFLGAVAALAAIALGFGWLFGRLNEQPPVEDLIPQAPTAAVGPAAEDPSSGQPTSGLAVNAPGPTVAVGASTDPRGAGDGDGGNGEEEEDDGGEDDGLLVVHVAGAVVSPGLVSVSVGARVNDVIQAAGGPTSVADLHRLNLAAPIQDGMQVRVPSVGDEQTGPFVVSPAPATDGGPDDSVSRAGPVNLNTASVELLDTLPGVGPATAAAIMSWREANGGFHTPEDLLAVPGIGQAKLAALRDLVTV